MNIYEVAGSAAMLPMQMQSTANKNKDIDSVYGISAFRKSCMDAFETIAKQQYMQKVYYEDNEKLANGQFAIPSDYVDGCEDCGSFADPLYELIKNGDLPNFMKHYDIISDEMNEMVSEFSKLPSLIRIVATGEDFENDYFQDKLALIHTYVSDKLNEKIDQILNTDAILSQQFPDEEARQAAIQDVMKKKDDMTPESFKTYMGYSYRHIAELWAEYELIDQQSRFDLKKKRRAEYRAFLTFGERVRLLTINGDKLELKSIHPRNAFCQKSAGLEYYQDADYAGVIDTLTTSDVVNMYAHHITEKQLLSLDVLGKNIGSSNGQSLNYTIAGDGFVPSVNKAYNRIAPHLGMNNVSLSSVLTSLSGDVVMDDRVWTRVIAYWWSYKRVAKLDWVNPSSGVREVVIVSDDFVIPPYVKVISETTPSKTEENTLCYTWQLEQWSGIKISSNNNASAIYINVGPISYQPNFNYNNTSKKLLITGQCTTKAASGRPISYVDGKKSYQFFHNILMNKAMKMLESSYIPFFSIDLQNLPNEESWRGKDALAKWLNAGQQNGVVPANSSPGINPAPPRLIDIDLTPRIMQYINIAEQIRMISSNRSGMTPQRMMSVDAVDSATGIKTSPSKSFSMSDVWITSFMECEKDILKLQLDIEQYLQSKNDTLRVKILHSDFTQSFLKFNTERFSLYDFHIYLDDSQEALKNVYDIKSIVLQNTSNASLMTRIAVLTSNNISEIKEIAIQEEKKSNALREQMQQMETQKLQAASEEEAKKFEREKELLAIRINGNIQESWVRSRGYISAGEQDLDGSKTPDAFEYEKFTRQAEADANEARLAMQKSMNQDNKQQLDMLSKQASLELKRRDLDLKELKIKQSGINSRLMDKGQYNN